MNRGKVRHFSLIVFIKINIKCRTIRNDTKEFLYIKARAIPHVKSKGGKHGKYNDKAMYN